MNNQNYNSQNLDESIVLLKNRIQQNYKIIEREKTKIKITTNIINTIKILYIIIGVCALFCFGSCVVKSVSSETSNSFCS